MKHLICSVGPRRFVITGENGNTIEDRTIELIKFVDLQNQEKYINPVHSMAWDTMMRLFYGGD